MVPLMIASDSVMETLGDTRGFTLVEVIVAMAVLAIVMVTLFRLQSSTVGLSEAAAFKQAAPRLALGQIDALEENGFNPGELPQEFKGRYQNYSWTCDIKEGSWSADWDGILSSRQVKGLRRIQMTILSPEQKRSFTLLTWRYRHEE
jgi:prepilin-type N-terminal cleavage/methylation domain-containing protein